MRIEGLRPRRPRRPGLIDRIATRLSGRPAFQRFAFATPGLREVARRRALALFDLVAGFVHSQVLAACLQLQLFRLLGEQARTAPDVAALTGLDPGAAERLLDAATALDLFWRDGRGRYHPGLLAGPLLGDGGGVAAMVAHHDALYADLADPVAFLRGWPQAPTALARYWPYGSDGAKLSGSEAYSRLMTASQDLVTADALDALGEVGDGPWLDLGGGEGGFLAEVARRAPGLRGTLVDLPEVAVRAAARFERLGLGDRLTAQGGDLLRAPGAETLGGFATASLIRVLHDHDDTAALALLRRARAALPFGARLLVAEPMRGGAGDPRISDAYFGPYLLAMGRGRPRMPQALAALAAEAGFTRAIWLPTRRPFLAQAMLFC